MAEDCRFPHTTTGLRCRHCGEDTVTLTQNKAGDGTISCCNCGSERPFRFIRELESGRARFSLDRRN